MTPTDTGTTPNDSNSKRLQTSPDDSDSKRLRVTPNNSKRLRRTPKDSAGLPSSPGDSGRLRMTQTPGGASRSGFAGVGVGSESWVRSKEHIISPHFASIDDEKVARVEAYKPTNGCFSAYQLTHDNGFDSSTLPASSIRTCEASSATPQDHHSGHIPKLITY